MTIEQLTKNPQEEPTFADIAAAAADLHVRCINVITSEHEPDNGVYYDKAADAAELLVVMLMRHNNNSRMMSYVADELARAVKRGW